jgi:hypothetical protein
LASGSAALDLALNHMMFLVARDARSCITSLLSFFSPLLAYYLVDKLRSRICLITSALTRISISFFA